MPTRFTIEVCLSPALIDFILTKGESIVVVTDILRATTSMISALAHGARSIIPAASLEKAIALKKQGMPVAAERDGSILDFADFGNSAFDFMDNKIRGKRLVFSTTNGTTAILRAAELGTVVLGGFSNLSSLTDWISGHESNIIILCSGWKNTFCLEDTLFAGALIEKLYSSGNYTMKCDAAHAALDLWTMAKSDVKGYVEKALHRDRLRQLGADDVIEFSFQTDTLPVVPVWTNGELVDVLNTEKPDVA